jgi:hypothetical protein
MRSAFWRCRAAAAALAALTVAGAALAADEAPRRMLFDRGTLDMSATPDARPEPVPVRYGENILLGRIARNLEKSGASAKLNYLADQSLAGVQHEAAQLGAGDTLLRATRSAVKSILKDVAETQMGLGDFLDRMQSGSGKQLGSGSGAASAAPSTSNVRFQVGISRYLPRLDMRLNNGAVATKLSVTAYGTVGIDLAPVTSTRLAFHAGYDAREKTADFRCLIRF